MSVIDPRCPWVHYQDGTNIKVLSVDYVPPELSQGRIGIYVYALRQKIATWGVPYDLLLPGSEDHYATMPEFVIDMAGGGFDPQKGSGPFKIQMADAWVDGLGLPVNRHVVYVVQYKLVSPRP